MTFKSNLLDKIKIDRLVREIGQGIGTVDSGQRINTGLLHRLMTFFPWIHRQERDLDLYLESDAQPCRILVLDNDLTIYRATTDDVVLRKSPTVKEMVSFRNAIKILNDKDVVLTKKEASLEIIHQICVGELDLDFTDADITALAAEGTASLKDGYADGVRETLMLFAELLELVPAPKAFALEHHDIYGKTGQKTNGEQTLGPLVMFSLVHETLTCLEGPLGSRDKGRFDRLESVASGEAEAAASGAAVFEMMAGKVLAGNT
ncbi:MAG: hypothetical protein CR984_07685 [Proteobacteria bacterium]|nr:MAG: hypothetical protein CR984_07685 [Pseudomonadota bacterium]